MVPRNLGNFCGFRKLFSSLVRYGAFGKLGSTLNTPPSTVNPVHEGSSLSGAPVLGFGLADCLLMRNRVH